MRTADGTSKLASRSTCAQTYIHEAFGAKGIDGPGYVVYGTTPHFKGQPPTENSMDRAPARVGECVRVRNQGRQDGRRRYTRRDTSLRTASFVVSVREAKPRWRVRRRGDRRRRRGRLQPGADAGARRRRLGTARGGSAASGFVRRRGKQRTTGRRAGEAAIRARGWLGRGVLHCTYAAVKFNLFECVRK